MAKIFLDYGHGGSDSGAVGNGVVEKNANLVTGLSCAAELRRHGVTVSEARTTDVFVSLDARTSKANSLGVNYFVSIHHNAGGGDRGEGIHSIYRGKGQALANTILDEMAAKLGQQKKAYEKRGTDNKDYYHVIRNTNMDAVIVEVCFLDNKADVQIADTIPEQQRNGIVIAHGILKHLGIAIKTNNNTVNVKKYRNIIVYKEGTADKDTAEFFNRILNCRGQDSICVTDTEYKKGFITGTSVHAVGGGLKDMKATKHHYGLGRNETAQAVLEHLK